MGISIRDESFTIPTYSLTGDILSYHNCPLQYRYYSGSSLPPSRPVQMWVGEFLHGVLEEAYLTWRDNPQFQNFPWPNAYIRNESQIDKTKLSQNDIYIIGDAISKKLHAQGKNPRNINLKEIAFHRVEKTINTLGPQLFPLIENTEKKMSSTRQYPAFNPPNGQRLRGDQRYELTGIADVISSARLNANVQNRQFLQMIINHLGNVNGDFEILVDYKGMRRPPINDPNNLTWEHHEHQLNTYAWLRNSQPGDHNVRAGVIIYINELLPSVRDLVDFINDINSGKTDIRPANGDPDYYRLFNWNRVQPTPPLSDGLLLQRAVRIVTIDAASVQHSLGFIDDTVRDIEVSVLNENSTGAIKANWSTQFDENTCVACDFRVTCPNPTCVQRAFTGIIDS